MVTIRSALFARFVSVDRSAGFGAFGGCDEDPDVHGSADHVRVGDDVAVGIDHDSGAGGSLAGEGGAFFAVLLIGRAVAADDDLDHGGRDLLG